MTEKELEARQALIAQPAARSASRVPLEQLLAEALRLAEALPAKSPDGEREERRIEARKILHRLPEFARAGGIGHRVHDARLRESVAAWGWGAPGLMLLGPTGIGKSSAAAALLVRLLVQGWRDGGARWDAARWIRWFSADDLSRARREHPLGRGDAPELYDAEGASLLVIDDAGWDREPDCVSSVLAKRYERKLPTIITSGRTIEELSVHYGAAVIRRIVDSGGQRAKLVSCFAPRVVDAPIVQLTQARR
jgi:hypothetical protein